MTQRNRKRLLGRMTYVELTQVIENGNKNLKQLNLSKSERNEILKDIAGAEKERSSYRDVQTNLSGNFN